MPFEEKIKNKIPLTNYEICQVIQYLINQSRIESQVSFDDLMKCRECTAWISKKLPNNSYIININGLKIGTPNTFVHYFQLIFLYTKTGFKYFILDPVFDQFNTNKYKIGRNYYNCINIFSKNKKFFTELTIKKYFELTEENLNQYLSNFIKLCNITNQKLDKDVIINNAINLLIPEEIQKSKTKTKVI